MWNNFAVRCKNFFSGKSSEYCRSIVDSVFHLCHSNTCVHSFFAGLPKDFCPLLYLSQKISKIHSNCSYSQGTKSSLPSATNSLWNSFFNWLSSGFTSWWEMTKWSALFCNQEGPNKNSGLMKRVLSLFRVPSYDLWRALSLLYQPPTLIDWLGSAFHPHPSMLGFKFSTITPIFSLTRHDWTWQIGKYV